MGNPTDQRFKSVPPDFGGFIGFWHEGRAQLVRYGHGRPVEGVSMTPLNLLQARKLLDDLIEQGKEGGQITAEHVGQSEQLPSSVGLDLELVMPRDQVDKIAGTD